MRVAIKITLAIVLLLGVAAGALFWRLAQGPLSLAGVQPLLQTLVERSSPYAVTFTQPSLVWLRQEGVLALEVHDIEARTREGDFVFAAPVARATVALRPLLLEQQVEPVAIQLDLPELELTRDTDGRLVLGFAGQLASLPLSEGAGGGGVTVLLGEAGGSDPRLSRLELVRVTAPQLQFVDIPSDQRFTAADPLFELSRQGAGWSVALDAGLGDGRIEITAEPTAVPTEQRVAIDLRRFPLHELRALAPDLPLADLVAVPLSGTIRFTLDPGTRALGAGTVAVSVENGQLVIPTLGPAPVGLDSAQLRARLEPGWRKGEIQRLEVATAGAKVGLSGPVGLADDRLEASLALDAQGLDARQALERWPPDAAPEARAWAERNLLGAKVAADLTQLQLAAAGSSVALAGRLGLMADQLWANLHLDVHGLEIDAMAGAAAGQALRTGEIVARIGSLQLAQDGFALDLSGEGSLAQGTPKASLKVAATDLDVPDVVRLWPEGVAAEARGWVAANVPRGRIGSASFDLDDDSPRPNQPDIAAGFTFADAEVRYLDTLPPATGLGGSASFAGDSLGFKLGGGRTGEVELTRGDVALSHVTGPATSQLKVDLTLRSTVPAAMQLLDAEPVQLGKVTGLSPRRASGQQATRLELSLPLLDDIPRSRIRYKATTKLTDLELKEVRPGYGLAARSLNLVADQTGIASKGEVRVNGVPLGIDWRENDPPVKGVTRRLKAAGTADAAAARALRLDWPSLLGGSIRVDATLVEAKAPLRTVDLALDLQETEIDLPQLVLAKRRGQPGKASARLVQADERSLTIERAQVDTAGILADGGARLRLDPLQPESVSLRQLRLPLGELSAELTQQRDQWRGRVDIVRADLRPALQAGSGGSGPGMTLPDFALDVSARYLRLGDAPLTNLAGPVERRAGIWHSARLHGNVEDSEVDLDLNTLAGQRSALSLRSSDAGWLIRAFTGDDKGVRGGRLRLSADLRQAPAGTTGSGELKIRDFTLWGAPTIARIISLASFSGLANALSGRGVPVQRLVAPFELQPGRIRLDQARLVGSDIGARADGTINLSTDTLDIRGTVAPAYTINRILGRIPILGQIMSGGRSDAALAATFSVTGPLGQPSVSVNPLAALVPGLIRDLFSALTADNSSDLAPVDQR